MGVCGWGGVHAADPQLAQWIVLSHLRDHHRHHGLPLSRGWSCRRVAKTACFCKPATSHNLHTETNLLKFTEFSLLHTEKIQLSATLFLFVRTCRMAAFALLAGVAVSFAPPMAVARAGVSTPTTQLAHLAAAPRAAPPAMSAVGALRVAAAMPTLYALMSVNEYMTHRWYQHAEFNKEPLLQKLWCMLTFAKVAPKIRGGGHVEHHAETYDDMSLKKDERWLRTPAAKSLDSDVFRGTAFSWKVTALMCIQMLPTTLPAFALLGFSLPATFALFFPAMALHGAMWNALHPPMHGEPTFLRGLPFSCFEPLFSRFFSCVFSFFFSSPPPPPPPIARIIPQMPHSQFPQHITRMFSHSLTGLGRVPLSYGLPSRWLDWLRETKYFKYIYQNHIGHHVLGGQCNYNVCCPLTDHLLGTYVPQNMWEPQMRPLPQGALRRGEPLAPEGMPWPKQAAGVAAAPAAA